MKAELTEGVRGGAAERPPPVDYSSTEYIVPSPVLFLKDDFSAWRRHSDKDYENGTISLEDQEHMGRVREIHGAAWNGLAKEKGQKYDPAAYGKDSP